MTVCQKLKKNINNDKETLQLVYNILVAVTFKMHYKKAIPNIDLNKELVKLLRDKENVIDIKQSEAYRILNMEIGEE